MRLRTLLAVLATGVVGAALSPAVAGAATAHGVVVARSHGNMLVATRSGRVVEVKGHAAVGSLMAGSRVVGRATHARIHGVVVSKKGSTLFVASNHHLVAIRTAKRHLAGNSGSTGDAPGTIVTATVTPHANGQLTEDDQTESGQDNASTLQLQATVSAVGPGTITLTVNGQDLTVNLPAGLTLPQSLVGTTVTIDVSLSQGEDNQGDVSGSVGADDSGSGNGSGSGSGDDPGSGNGSGSGD